MATKKGSKSSKTAHVLNVLSGPKQETGTEDGELEKSGEKSEGEAAQEVVPSRPVRVPVLEVARANDDALADQIRDLLEEDFAEQETAEDQIAEMESTFEPLADQKQEDVSEDVASDLPHAQPVHTPLLSESSEKKEESQTISKDEESQENALLDCVELEDDFCYVNIMQTLVEEKSKKYIEMFGLCTCSRCIADVKALALSLLPPKYIVMQKGEIIPMLTVYEGRFSTALTAQIINACKVVMEHPRH